MGAPQHGQGRVGVVFSAGGARGAYEAGALIGLAPVLRRRGEWPEVFTGASVGAVNALSAAGLSHLSAGEFAERSAAGWRRVVRPKVFRSVTSHLPRLLARYGADVALPGRRRVHALLDSTPLDRHLPCWVDLATVAGNVRVGRVHAAAAIATGAYTGVCTGFWSGDERLAPENGPVRYVRARLRAAHLRAATAIPLLFPAAHVDQPGAEGWYLDGSVGLRSPIRPALDLGAERLVLIGTGGLAFPSARTSDAGPQPALADAAATELHAMTADGLRQDALRLAGSGRPHIAIAPRHPGEIGDVATRVLRENYRSGAGRLRDLALIDRLAGGDSPLHGELVSFLLFDADFIGALLEIGKRDARRWLEEHPDVWAR